MKIKGNPTLNFLKKNLSDKHNNHKGCNTDFGKENTFDQIVFTDKQNHKNKGYMDKKNLEYSKDFDSDDIEIISSVALEDNKTY